MQKQVYAPLMVLLLLAAACNSGTDVKPAATQQENTAAAEKSSSTTSKAEKELSTVTFKVNDTIARTEKGAGTNDRDEQMGIYTEASKSLSLGLMGDVPGRPHRGWLNFSIVGFKFEPGSYTIDKNNHVSFSRYETENAGGETGYEASSGSVFKGTEMNLTISAIEPDPDSFNGKDWLASGSFSAKMLIKEHNPYKRTSNQGITITEGKFEKVRIAGGPKK